jgi:DNA-binding winged helix-turn-helix (wHTH) protein
MPVEVETRDLGRTPFRLGGWLVEPSLNRISRDGSTIQLELKWMDVLVCLAERAGEVVPRFEIIDRVWATEFITDNTLTHTIAELRNALGDDARNPTFIETIRQRGYRMIAPVKPAVSEEQMKSRVAKFPLRARPFADADERSPYPGLAAFTEADAEFFFGREAEVAKIWRKLTSRRLLAVIGPSGVGKSSFLRAGVIPAMPEGWSVLVSQPGEAPFAALARALVPEFEGDRGAISKLVHLRKSGETVAMISRWRRQYDQALLVVDQFEELFTQNPPEAQVDFAALLRKLVDESDVHVLLSMRDDFLYRCHSYGPLRPVFDSLSPLEQPSVESLRRALIEPARRRGYEFEDDQLAPEMVAEVEGERGALPLLAFAVARLWDARDHDQRLLTRQASTDIGGVGGALAQHAEKTLKGIGPERFSIVREIFRNLVTAEGTRALREVDELLSVFETNAVDPKNVGAGFIPARVDAETVLRQLIDARLLTSYEVRNADETPTRRIEIIHESLLANWPRLVRWQTQDVDAAQLRDQLRQAARTWDEHDRTRDFLWTGRAYREFALWRGVYPGGLTDVEEDFSAAMTHHSKRRRRRRRTVAASFLVLAVVLAVVFGTLWRRSDLEARRAEAQKLLALGQLELEGYPTATLAYARASLGLADTPEARLLALRALWEGAAARILEL